MFPEEISAMVLRDLKISAQHFLGTKVSKAVITVPAYFNNAQRQATMDAGKIAGLEIVTLINEPTSAAMAYGFNNVGKKLILIYDFGGGTFDVSLLRLNGKSVEVIGIDGDPYLGGEDLDYALVEHFIEQFEDEGLELREDKGLLRQLKTRCEETKRVLSTALEASFLLEGTQLKGTITRASFEELNYDAFQKTIQLVEKVIKDAKLTKADIDDIVLVGGSSRIPKVQKLLQECFDGKEPNKSINPDESVAMGAAIRAIMREDIPIPQFKGLKLSDVCPLSLGFMLHDGRMRVVIPRNTKIPTKRTDMVRPARSDQTQVEVEVYEGERTLCKDNHFLGSFELTDIPCDGQIDVIYEIDENSILSVKAIEEETKISDEIKIENKGRLTSTEIVQLITEAAKFAADDQIESDRIKSMNEYEDFLYSARRSVMRSFENDEINEKSFETVNTEINNKISWLHENRGAPKEQYEQYFENFKSFLKQYSKN